MKVTIDQVMNWRPCPDYPRRLVTKLFAAEVAAWAAACDAQLEMTVDVLRRMT